MEAGTTFHWRKKKSYTNQEKAIEATHKQLMKDSEEFKKTKQNKKQTKFRQMFLVDCKIEAHQKIFKGNVIPLNDIWTTEYDVASISVYKNWKYRDNEIFLP